MAESATNVNMRNRIQAALKRKLRAEIHDFHQDLPEEEKKWFYHDLIASLTELAEEY